MLLGFKYNFAIRGKEGKDNTWIIYKNPDVSGMEDFITADHIEIHTDIYTNEKALGLGFAIMASGKVTLTPYPSNPKKMFALIEEDYEV